MTIKTKVSADKNEIEITIGQRFDFRSHREFRDSYANSDGRKVHYKLDLRMTEYMDSSALGMLLLLREHAGGDARRLTLTNIKAEIMKILTISNFDKLFTIEGRE